jgi:hypothetical protein
MIYFMFHFGRSGSSVLTNSIGQHPNVFWHGEIFSKNVTIGDGFENTEYSKKQGGGEFTIEQFIEYIRKCIDFSNYKYKPSTIYGCEIKSYHFEYNNFKFSLAECLQKLQEEFDCEFIFLERKNSFRRILSCQIANQSNVWHVSSESKKTHLTYVDVNNFSDFDLNYTGTLIETLNHSNIKQAEYRYIVEKYDGAYFSYEDELEHDVYKGVNRLVSIMGLSDFKPEIKYKKTNPKGLNETVCNYDEVNEVLKSNKLNPYLIVED